MTNNKYYTVRAYFYKDGEYELQEYASGLSHNPASDYFRRLHNTNEYAKLTMTPMEGYTYGQYDIYHQR